MKIKLIYFSFVVALISTMGSLFFSNIMYLPPCNLCWWQRICMYPLVYIFGVGFITKDNRSYIYSLGLIVTGWVISLYHNLLYFEVIQNPIIPCTSGVSCTSKEIEWFGFISIPMMSFFAFTLLVIISLKLIKTKEV